LIAELAIPETYEPGKPVASFFPALAGNLFYSIPPFLPGEERRREGRTEEEFFWYLLFSAVFALPPNFPEFIFNLIFSGLHLQTTSTSVVDRRVRWIGVALLVEGA
jgi:hypothetical protein